MAEIKAGDKWVPVWRIWGYTGWSRYAEKELGIHRARAYPMIDIWRHFELRLHGRFSKALLLGISKMRLLAKITTPDNVDGWLKKAKDMNVSSLEAVVEARTANRDGRKARMVLVQFYARVTPGEAKVIAQAMDRARSASEKTVRRGELLARAARGYLAGTAKIIRLPVRRRRAA